MALGARLKTHLAAKPKYWGVPLGVVIAAGGTFMAVGPWLYPDPRAGLGTNIPVSIMGLLLTALGVMAAASVFMGRGRKVFVHEHGIVEERGERRVEMLWDEVATLLCARQRVTQAGGLVTHQLASFKLQTGGGKKLLLDHRLAEILALGEEIEAQVSRCLQPKIRASFAQGQRVSFAPLVVTHQQLERGRRTLPWEQLAGAEVAEGEVRIFRRGEPTAWTKIQYASLTNAQALLDLISSRLKSTPP